MRWWFNRAKRRLTMSPGGPMMKFVTVAATLTCAAALVACSDQSQDPTALSLAGPSLQTSSVGFWDVGASVSWNAIERNLLIKIRFADQREAFCKSTYLSLAQYDADH